VGVGVLGLGCLSRQLALPEVGLGDRTGLTGRQGGSGQCIERQVDSPFV